MSDYRIEAAIKEEWAERALRAEAERDQWKAAAEKTYAALVSMRKDRDDAMRADNDAQRLADRLRPLDGNFDPIARRPNPWHDV